MAGFIFTCPNCEYKITEKDFQENESILSNLKDVFKKHEEDYIKIVKDNLSKQITSQKELEIKQKLAEAEVVFEKQKQSEINKFQEIINQQKNEISNSELVLEKKMGELTHSLENKANQKIAELNNQIITLEAAIKNNNILIDQAKLEVKQEEMQKMTELERSLKNEITRLNGQIKDLELANTLNKVIQNKTKGENFEHEVEAELRKVFEPQDKIEKITAMDKKADYLQTVRLNDDVIGKIVYEVKNAEWSNAWEKKLTEDMARQNSKYGILVSTSFNKKFSGIPFKRSDENQNIYICDPESFIFVGQILKTLILTEYKLTINKNEGEHAAKVDLFNQWKDTQLPVLNKLFVDSFERIKSAESGITKQVDEIRIAREKMLNNWIKNIKDYLDKLSF